MALRNRCCTEEEAQHKHDFDWLLEATTKVTIYISVTQLYKPAKHAVEKQRGKEKPRRNPSLNFLPPCVIYMHATNCDDQVGENMDWVAWLLSFSFPPRYLSPSILLLSFLFSPPQKSQECVKHLVQNHSIPIDCQSRTTAHRYPILSPCHPENFFP